MEWDDRFPRLGCGEEREKGEGPGIAERGAVEGCAARRPDRREAVNEYGPEGWEGDDGDGRGLGCGVGEKVV